MDKFNLYELLSWLVPGVLVTCILAVAFPQATAAVKAVGFQDAFAVTALVALAVFIGNLVQAVASLTEPLMNWTWGGRPSERALREGLGNRYLPGDAADRIRIKIIAAIGGTPSDRSVFLFATQRAESAASPRVGVFNALYAYHRALLVLCLIGLAALIAAACANAFPGVHFWGWVVVFAGGIAVTVLVWYRTKQRAFYYVREVLLTAERVIDQAPPKSPSPTP
jgi:hypothetical protein